MGQFPKIVFSEGEENLLKRGFAAHRHVREIARQLKAATGKKVSERTVYRQQALWRREMQGFKERKQNARAFWEVTQEGKVPSEIAMSLLLEYLDKNPEALTSADPIQVHRLGLQGEALQLRTRQVEVQEHRVDLQERRLALVEEREKLAVAALEEKGKGEELSPEERIARVRAIYGLNNGTETTTL